MSLYCMAGENANTFLGVGDNRRNHFCIPTPIPEAKEKNTSPISISIAMHIAQRIPWRFVSTKISFLVQR